MGTPDQRSNAAPFSEKGFYLNEFRGRTIAIAGAAADLRAGEPLESVLKELEANRTRALIFCVEPGALEALSVPKRVAAGAERLEACVWRAFAEAPRVGLVVESEPALASVCRETVLRLGITKLVWLEGKGGLVRADGSRESFVDLKALRERLRAGRGGETPAREALLHEIERALEAGVPAVNLCSARGLGDELFTYAGSGTLFTRQRYVSVRRLGLDDFDAANDLVVRGMAEGYLAPRSPEEVEQVLASGFGAFVEDRHLAGIGALLFHESSGAGEIASLYTLTRFLGEGVGAHLVRFALEQARERGCPYVFACTTSERVVGFFEREDFCRVSPDEVPPEKWRDYDPNRKARATCLRRDTGPKKGLG